MFKRIMNYFFRKNTNDDEDDSSSETFRLKLLNQCLNTYTSMDPNLKIPTESLFLTIIRPNKPNIDAYIKTLETLVYKIKHDEVITWADIEGVNIDVTLEIFFTDVNKMYLDPNESLSQFQSAVIDLCHELLLDRENIEGTHTHNRSIVIVILQNLIDIGKKIK